MATKGKYAGLSAKQRWAKNPNHKIPFATHEQNVKAKQALGTLDLTAPPTAGQALTEANSAADLQYGPQVQAAQQAQANVKPWFQDYMARVAGYATAAQTQTAPVLGQAQAYQAAAGAQTTPGLDPNSAAGQQAAQAAQGRQALSQLGLDALNAGAQATQDYFTGQGNMAARVQPQVQAAAGQQLANAQSQRGAAVQGFLTTARQNAQNYAIARGTLNLNSDKAAADTDINRGVDPVTGKPLPSKPATTKSSGPFAGMTDEQIGGLSDTDRQKKIDAYNASKGTTSGGAKINKYGIPTDQFAHWSTSHRQRVINKFAKKGTDTPKGTDPAKIQAASGKIHNQITNVTDYQQTIIGQETDDTSKPIKDSSGKNPKDTGWKPTYEPRKVTQADVDKMKIAKYGTLAKIAIAVRDGQKLTPDEVDYLHNMDVNYRIPREWLPGDQRRGVTQPLNRGSGGNAPSKTGV